MTTTDRTESTDRLAPGRYQITREFKFNGTPFSKTMIVANPIYAYDKLDEWENTVALVSRAARRSAA